MYMGISLYRYIVAGSASTARQSPQSEFIRMVLGHFYDRDRNRQVPGYLRALGKLISSSKSQLVGREGPRAEESKVRQTPWTGYY